MFAAIALTVAVAVAADAQPLTNASDYNCMQWNLNDQIGNAGQWFEAGYSMAALSFVRSSLPRAITVRELTAGIQAQCRADNSLRVADIVQYLLGNAPSPRGGGL
jgi:hypothetical protein